MRPGLQSGRSPLVMFHHVYKAAGSTVNWILERNFPGAVLHVEGRGSGSRLLREDLLEAMGRYPDSACLTSHSAPLPSRDNTWARVHLVFLRDPLDRFFSMYKYGRRPEVPATPDSPIARRSKFRDYCRWWMELENGRWMNWQTRCCTPQSASTLESSGGWHLDFEAARDSLTKVVLAGTLETFDKSMVVLEAVMAEAGVDLDASYIRQNVSTQGEGAPQKLAEPAAPSGDSFFEEFTRRNELDAGLVRLVDALIERRFAQLPDGPGRLHDFRDRCESLREAGGDPTVIVPTSADWVRVGSELVDGGEGEPRS